MICPFGPADVALLAARHKDDYVKIGIIGTGQFAGAFAHLFNIHPDVSAVYATDLIPERAHELVQRTKINGVMATVDEMLESDVDAVVVMTQRWLHHETVMRALRAGKHVYSAVPMAVTVEEISDIVGAVRDLGLCYMMGETSYYNSSVVYARGRVQAGDFGRMFYAEGDYVHDMEHGFYAAYQYSGGDSWKSTASFPPMLYPTHSIGGVIGAWDTHAVSVSALGIHDEEQDGVFDTTVSLWGNDYSNMSALFEMADGGVMRTNEFRRVGHPGWANESRFRFYGTKAVMEQHSQSATFATSDSIVDIWPDVWCGPTRHGRQAEVADLDPALLHSFQSGHARAHDTTRLPKAYEGEPNGHQGSHQFLTDDFVRAVRDGRQPIINAWQAARMTLPGVIALESARRGGERLPIPDFGDCPFPVIEI